MREGIGDLWDFECDVRCVTTNGDRATDGGLVMGAGLAKQAALMYRRLPYLFGKWIELYDNTPCFVPCYNVVSFPTKHHWREPSDITLIMDSAKAIRLLADLHGWEDIASVRPGCGLGCLAWDNVREVLAKIWDDRFVILEKQ